MSQKYKFFTAHEQSVDKIKQIENIILARAFGALTLNGGSRLHTHRR